MGSFYSSPVADVPNPDFIHQNGHKIYIVTSDRCTFFKLGYTSQNIRRGVWSPYHRAFGDSLCIVKIYPAVKKLEDLDIHKYLMKKYNIKNKKDEIYDKSIMKKVIKDLDTWHGCCGLGPFLKGELPIFRESNSNIIKNKIRTVEIVSLEPTNRKSSKTQNLNTIKKVDNIKTVKSTSKNVNNDINRTKNRIVVDIDTKEKNEHKVKPKKQSTNNKKQDNRNSKIKSSGNSLIDGWVVVSKK